jgi:protease IV
MRELLAHVQFRGTIRDRSVEPYLGLLKALREKKRVRGVLFDISSGGGGSVASADLRLALKRLDAVKPVVASIGSTGASGAYLAVCGARTIFAYPDSAVGSIGVIYPNVVLEKLLGKIGVDVELLHEGRHKDAFQGIRPLTDEERAKLQGITRGVYDEFVRAVAEDRHRPVEEILPLATGEFWTGRRALELHLIDAVGDREAALLELARITGVPAKKLVRVAPPRSFLERVTGGFGGSVADVAQVRVREALEDALLDLRFGGLG